MARMIKVTAGTTTRSFVKIVEASVTLDSFVQENGLNTPGATLQLDGRPVADLSKTFGDVITGEECYLFGVVNAKNA